MTQRTNYDEVAAEYDVEPHRAKSVDSELIEFLAEWVGEPPLVLDVGCGTGNQLVANKAEFPDLPMFGLDRYGGMLQQARQKPGSISWLQGDGADLPFRSESFGYISNQLSFHHVQRKAAMIAELYRVLGPGGRFVMSNFDPRETRQWALYDYFPAARERDLRDFPPNEEIMAMMREVGFVNVSVALEIIEFEQTMQDFADEARRRVTSQLTVISDADYQAGLQQVEQDLARGQIVSVQSAICMMKMRGDKRVC